MYDMVEHLRVSRRAAVGDAYARQFRKDFTQFLSLRAQELVTGGRMVISLYGRCSENPISRSNQAWQVVAVALNDMASRVSTCFVLPALFFFQDNGSLIYCIHLVTSSRLRFPCPLSYICLRWVTIVAIYCYLTTKEFSLWTYILPHDRIFMNNQFAFVGYH